MVPSAAVKVDSQGGECPEPGLARSVSSCSLTALLSLAVLAACGGSSDDADGDDAAASGGDTKLSLVAYAVPKVGYDKVIPLFQKTDAGKDVSFSQSYGASGDQSRKVEAGLPTDVVNFSVEPDVTRLVDAGLVDKDWNANEHKGFPFGSVVTIVTRKGNPENIKTWDDLLKPGIEIVTPNPFSSGSAKWNLLAPYAEKSEGGKNPDAGLEYLSKLIGRPREGAAEVGPRGHGDLPPGHRRRAAQLRERGDLRPAAGRGRGLRDAGHHVQDREPGGRAEQRQGAGGGPGVRRLPLHARGPARLGRGRLPARWTRRVAEEFADDFPEPKKLWTIDDLGGWGKVNDELFDEENGSVAKIYEEATG